MGGRITSPDVIDLHDEELSFKARARILLLLPRRTFKLRDTRLLFVTAECPQPEVKRGSGEEFDEPPRPQPGHGFPLLVEWADGDTNLQLSVLPSTHNDNEHVASFGRMCWAWRCVGRLNLTFCIPSPLSAKIF